ncbi:tRNA(Ile)-lysidine synthase [Syntrophobotulus glycolicus DSM 8271]|uniref:tRNA(Ile)-lysidine synthase n=1 Tax=Syntrophobotulus glycolicus (strain DSM 8271 / FlGlyR) TaxID=645991 RepID=F0SW95_SYNGF|nr:tRNA lysidine(34) synthetase TilS [Syntrophobotulus glycolicus]ADY54581.1 tRNA(Ile)-lysidine synthase [Syntrophobotulus glycolicus DSM 8271]
MYARLKKDILPILVPSGSRILVAVSGGPDSIALWHILDRYAREEKSDISLVISHIHHGVRRESDQEEEMVRKLAGKFETELSVHRFKAKDYADKSKKSFQEAAREWRYARFQEDKDKYQCHLIATAHHLGDQAETLLYRLLRGSGTSGLGGIYPSAGEIIRPLLTVSKQEILAYCEAEGLSFALDQSNFEPVYVRNKIRLELLPILKKNYNSRIEEALGRTAELLRWDEEYIQTQVVALWSRYCLEEDGRRIVFSREAWQEPNAVLSRLLRLAAEKINGDPRGLEFKLIKTLMEEGWQQDWQQDLPGIKVCGMKEGLVFLRREIKSEEKDHNKKENIPAERERQKHEVQLEKNRWNSSNELGIKVLLSQESKTDQQCLSTVLSGNALERLEVPLVCRARKNGDRMFWRGIGHKAIKKVFQEHGITGEERRKIPLIAVGSLVIWIPGVCRSDSLLPQNEDEEKWFCLIRHIPRSLL